VPVSVDLLGPVVLAVDGVAATPSGARERGLLAVLAGSRAAVPADVLLDRVWGEHGASKGALQVTVHALRGRLGPHADLLRHTPGGYHLDGPVLTVDTDRLGNLTEAATAAAAGGDHVTASDALRTALGLFRGDYCADLPDLPLEAERTAFAEQRLALLEDSLEAELRLGTSSVTGVLEALVLEHPFRERLWGLLAIALYAAQRQVDALAVFRRAREVLLEEAGVDPGPELRTLEQAVLNQSDPLALLSSRADTAPALLWLDALGQPRRRDLPEKGDLVIGRLEGTDVRLDEDGGVSRRHAAVRRSGLGWEVADLGSLNGTLVNGTPVLEPVPVGSGDRIRCGRTTFLVTTATRRGPGAEVLTTQRL
jgi:DNA-binding SARP family transcriptional activator